jgi:hypothetical protein
MGCVQNIASKGLVGPKAKAPANAGAFLISILSIAD